MPQLTTKEVERFTQEFSKSLLQPQAPAKPAADAVDLKAIFCKDWPSIAAGLQVLQSLLPAPISAIVGIVIAAGNALSKAIC